jgi:pimeloyl-ACP methyl ester carboxylesterase
MPVSRKLMLSTGLTYHVLEWDGGGDHTVLLLHGYLDNAWGWQPVVDAGLGRRAHVVAPDLRGHGDSDWIGAGGYYHFLDYLADVHDVVAELGRARLSVVGHSMGGRVAAYYAGAFPERVHRLALLEGLGPPAENEPAAERVAPWLAACRRARAQTPRTYASLDDAAARMVERDPRLSPVLARTLADKGTVRQPDGRLRFKHDPLQVTPPPLGFTVELASGFWQRVRCPTLLIDGAESPQRMSVEEVERRAGAFARARRLLLPGAAHMVQRHQPEAVAALLDDFLELS